MHTKVAPKPTKVRRKHLNLTLDAQLVDNIIHQSNLQKRKISNYVEILLTEKCPELMDLSTY